MSLIKTQIFENILKPIQTIQEESLNKNNLESQMNYLNAFLKMHEHIEQNAPKICTIWNEIIDDVISIIVNEISGFYHTVNICLRSVLELSCSALYYYDHPIEYYLYEKHDYSADKYVSTLVNQHSFYTTKYINAFYSNIEAIQKEKDSISNKLKLIYSQLCDVVHGRYNTLTKTMELNIEYNDRYFNQARKNFEEVLSIIAVMFLLRFSSFVDKDVSELANRIGVVEFV